MSLAIFHPVTWLLVAQGLCITACAFYQGLGAHLVLGTLVQGASLATIYPFLEGWAKGFVASRPNLDDSAAVKLAADAWSLVRHTAKTVVIWGLWSPDFDVLVPWSPPSHLNPAPYTWAQTWVIILYYTCICDWFCDYYLYTRSCRLAKIRPKDYNVMLAHHAVTIFLMGGFRLCRLLCHWHLCSLPARVDGHFYFAGEDFQDDQIPVPGASLFY